MRKFLFAIFLCFLPVAGFCGHKFKYTEGGSCALDRSGNDKYWFCGSKGSSCQGVDVAKNDVVTTMSTNEIKTDYRPNGTHTHFSWICCNGKLSFHTAEKATPKGWSATTKDEKCTADSCAGGASDKDKDCKQKYDACGQKTGKCEVVPCDEGTDWRPSSKSCAPRCVSGSAYESETSNTCVECPETEYQGISESNVCIKCSSDTQFWKPSEKKCVLFSAATDDQKHTNHEFQQCWKCANDASRFKTCLGKAHISMGDADSYVKTDCSLTNPPENP